jgi:small subunit ribosomal protein S13
VSSSSFRYVVRIARTDLDGTLKLERALSDIKGVGQRFARALVQAAGLNPDQRMGFVTEADVAKIEEVLKDPVKFGIPGWMVNRRKDIATGQDKHLVGSDLEFQLRTDIDGLMKIKSWRGVRHSLGLKVRGQRTRSTGRTGRAVGVTRKKE